MAGGEGKDMDYSEQYEHYLEKELNRCDSRYAFCQEISWLANSEMTELERRQENLLIALKRLRESRELYSLQMPSLNYDYTPSWLSIQEAEAFADYRVEKQIIGIRNEEVKV